jgi:hypothetical protein
MDWAGCQYDLVFKLMGWEGDIYKKVKINVEIIELEQENNPYFVAIQSYSVVQARHIHYLEGGV